MSANLSDLKDRINRSKNNLNDFFQVINSIYEVAPMSVTRNVLELKESNYEKKELLIDNIKNLTISFNDEKFYLEIEELKELFQEMNKLNSVAFSAAYISVLMQS